MSEIEYADMIKMQTLLRIAEPAAGMGQGGPVIGQTATFGSKRFATLIHFIMSGQSS